MAVQYSISTLLGLVSKILPDLLKAGTRRFLLPLVFICSPRCTIVAGIAFGAVEAALAIMYGYRDCIL
jgi:hypothetical protein